jgi:predicted small lipoprotein YifL
MRRHFTPLLLLTAFALTGCGVTGNLKTPPPLFGDKTKLPSAETAQEDRGSDAEREDDDLLDILEELND